MITTRPARIVLRIGTLAMGEADVIIEAYHHSGEWRLSALISNTMHGEQVRIEADGIAMAGGRWLQSPLAKAYWTAAQHHLDTHPISPLEVAL